MVTKPNQNSHGVEDIDVASLGRALWRAKGWIFWLAISAGARLIKDMLAKNGDVDATTEVLKSDLITRLIEQRVTMQRQLAELSATLLPSHPAFGSLRPSLPTCANRSAPKSRRLHRAWRMRHRSRPREKPRCARASTT